MVSIVCEGEAEEEEQQQQQMDLRGLLPEAIDSEGLRSRSHGKGTPSLRPVLQHVSSIPTASFLSIIRGGASAPTSLSRRLQAAAN